MLVRAASEADLPAIQAIYAHHVLHGLATFEEVPPTVDELRRRYAAVLALGAPYLVAVLDGELIGYSYATLFRERSAYRYTLEDSVYVAHHSARLGAGRALLSALIARCEAGPWRQLLAVIGDSANVGSIALHRELGFSHVGTAHATGFKLGRWVDIITMQRPLGPGATTPPLTPLS